MPICAGRGTNYDEYVTAMYPTTILRHSEIVNELFDNLQSSYYSIALLEKKI